MSLFFPSSSCFLLHPQLHYYTHNLQSQIHTCSLLFCKKFLLQGQKSLIRDILNRRCAPMSQFGLPGKLSTVDKYQVNPSCFMVSLLDSFFLTGSAKWYCFAFFGSHSPCRSFAGCSPSCCCHVSGASRSLRFWSSGFSALFFPFRCFSGLFVPGIVPKLLRTHSSVSALSATSYHFAAREKRAIWCHESLIGRGALGWW